MSLSRGPEAWWILPPATAPTTARAADPSQPVDETVLAWLSQVDPSMRRYMQERDETKMQLARTERNVGPSNVVVKNLRTHLELQNQRIQSHAHAYLAGLGGRPQPGR